MADDMEHQRKSSASDDDNDDEHDEADTKAVNPSRTITLGIKLLNEHVEDISPDFVAFGTEPIKWTVEEDAKLSQAIKLYGSHQWKLIAQYVGTRDPG
jgi:hypothetical protein